MKTSSDVLVGDDADATCGIRVVDAERVRAVRAALPAESHVADTAAVFALLGDPGRLKLLVALLEGEMCVCDLAAACGQGESAVSHQLRLLRAHRVVTARRAGRMAYYRLADAHVRLLLDVTLAHLEHTGPETAVAPSDPAPVPASAVSGGTAR
ncbi:ArsR/SmtB family transcription factor [Yinghuangia seranimata]|uniref:ArsR/SmtB family transcription factor n=1 Tax=Yinghuangia seranimata TaxID=408067 RepID=UPI00248B5437|nr:metalloregulator ArsR/SmtB family transcription factor [Yinghuangia seranimata]MDI2129139.1 metalloregulator ArsR/SmtB family transcription factor [Yinghuangia seranimata]